MSADDTLRAELAALDESIRDDERHLDSVVATDPTLRGEQAVADLRERISEGRMLHDRLARLIERMAAS